MEKNETIWIEEVKIWKPSCVKTKRTSGEI